VCSCSDHRPPAAACLAAVNPYLAPGQLGAPGTIPPPFLGPAPSTQPLGGAALPLLQGQSLHEAQMAARTQIAGHVLELQKALETFKRGKAQVQAQHQPDRPPTAPAARAAGPGPGPGLGLGGPSKQLPPPGPKVEA
jgi:hypothetical protein